MNYAQAIEFLDNSFVSFQTAGNPAYKEGLDRISAMCKRLENPQRDYLTIHVAGTNGKGSVAHILASVLQSAGYRTGLYTSPHLRDFRERIKIDGEKITEQAVARFVSDYGSKMVELRLSYFEMTTAMAFRYFAESDVEVAIIETGLGGRLDATNIIRPILSIITNVGLDHTDILGDTVEKIAAEKAGVIKRGVPVLVGESDARIDHIFVSAAARTESKIIFADRFFECLEKEPNGAYERYTLRRIFDGRTQMIDLDLLGEYQERNIVTARSAIHMLRHYTKINISTRALMTGCRSVTESTGLSGRWQKLSDSPTVIADTGHNAHAIKRIVEQLKDHSQEYDKLYMVIGFSADKRLDEILPLLPTGAHYIFTQAASPRALPAAVLAGKAAAYGLVGDVVEQALPALAAARAMAAPGDMIFVGGSSFVVAEVL